MNFSQQCRLCIWRNANGISRISSAISSPQLSVALEDMGLGGNVSFTTTASGPNAGYDTVAIKTFDKDKNPAVVTVKFASASPRGEYIVKLSSNGQDVITTASVREGDLVDVIESFFAEAYGKSSESREGKKSGKGSDDPDVEDAKECKAALDKYVVGSNKLKDYGLETVLTEDASIGAEMPFARVELGIRVKKSSKPYYKAGDLLEYFTFDFSGGTCHVTFHLQGEDWDEMLSDHPSVTSMVKDLVPDMIDELENNDLVDRPGDKS